MASERGRREVHNWDSLKRKVIKSYAQECTSKLIFTKIRIRAGKREMRLLNIQPSVLWWIQIRDEFNFHFIFIENSKHQLRLFEYKGMLHSLCPPHLAVRWNTGEGERGRGYVNKQKDNVSGFNYCPMLSAFSQENGFILIGILLGWHYFHKACKQSYFYFILTYLLKYVIE